MARRARVEYPGALYHVITRGNQHQRIFRDDRDRRKYLEILSNLKKQYSFRIPAYVLMHNHVHLLLESGEFRFHESCSGWAAPIRSTSIAGISKWGICFRVAIKPFYATKIVICWSSPVIFI